MPSLLLLRDGVGGTDPSPTLEVELRRERDSVESAALYFLEEARRLGVVERGRRSSEAVEMESTEARLGVKGTGRASLLVDDMGEQGLRCLLENAVVFGEVCRCRGG